MQVPYDEGVAIHIGPESCAVAREGLGEALTGVRVGQPLSRESSYSGCRHRAYGGRQHTRARQRERPDDPAWSESEPQLKLQQQNAQPSTAHYR